MLNLDICMGCMGCMGYMGEDCGKKINFFPMAQAQTQRVGIAWNDVKSPAPPATTGSAMAPEWTCAISPPECPPLSAKKRNAKNKHPLKKRLPEKRQEEAHCQQPWGLEDDSPRAGADAGHKRDR